jgi:hypothetical protein
MLVCVHLPQHVTCVCCCLQEGHSGASSSAAGASAAAGKMGPVSSPRAAQTQKVLRLQTDSAAGTVPDIAAAGCLLMLETLSVCTPGSKHVICRCASQQGLQCSADACSELRASVKRTCLVWQSAMSEVLSQLHPAKVRTQR